LAISCLTLRSRPVAAYPGFYESLTALFDHRIKLQRQSLPTLISWNAYNGTGKYSMRLDSKLPTLSQEVKKLLKEEASQALNLIDLTRSFQHSTGKILVTLLSHCERNSM